MKLITRDTDYAIRAVMAIAGKKGEVCDVTELVRELKTPKPFLRKILQRLQRAGVLTSYKGKGGGFTLKKRIENLRLTDIIIIFQGSLKLNECVLKRHLCPNRAKCPIRKKILGIESHVINELKSVKLGDLIGG